MAEATAGPRPAARMSARPPTGVWRAANWQAGVLGHGKAIPVRPSLLDHRGLLATRISFLVETASGASS